MTKYSYANQQKHLRKDPFSRWYLRRVMETLYRLIASTRPSSVLDAGCGEGFVIRYLVCRDQSLRVTGVDLQPEAIQYAKEYVSGPVTFQVEDLQDLSFPDNSFDTVVCSQVLEHLDDAESAIAELKRVARKYVIISVPNEPYFKWINNIAQATRLCMDPGHVNFWSHTDFQNIIRTHFRRAQFFRKHIIYQFAVASVESL